MSGDPRVTGEMPFLQHLEELRRVMIQALIGIAAGAIAGWWAAPHVLEDLIHRTVGEVVVLSPMDAFNERLKLSFILGAMVALPWVLWRLWSFVVPGLLKRERTWVMPMALASLLLFALGAAAAYLYVTPLVIQVLGHFMTPSMRMQIRIGSLLSFFYNLALACGVVCQLPLVCMSLTALGIVTPGFLMKQWRYAILITFLVTALITPGDVVTAQLVMGVPMVALYFASVGLSFVVARRKRREAGPGGAADHA